MKTPYEILEVADDADDETVKKAYLKKVREYPPERNVEAFQRIRDAFEQIKTDKQRRRYRLFHHEPPDLLDLLRQSLHPGAPLRPDVTVLLGALTEGVIDELFKNQTHQ